MKLEMPQVYNMANDGENKPPHGQNATSLLGHEMIWEGQAVASPASGDRGGRA